MRVGVHRGASAALPWALLCAMAAPAPAAHHPCRTCAAPDDIPFQWDDGAAQPPAPGPYPQGFALIVPVRPTALTPATPATLDRYPDVGAALGRCISADLASGDKRWADLTLRVSFRRDGTVNGLPRVAHVSAPDGATQSRARDDVLAALSRCTPLPFSPALGRAIAGQIFAIRFVQQRNI